MMKKSIKYQIIANLRAKSSSRRLVYFILPKLFFLLLLLASNQGVAQVKMPDMVQPGDTWGIIDANELYGGCMQVKSYADLLAVDVQYLKRGMIFIVYDYDGTAGNGIDTKAYMFLPASGVWDYETPFQIPAADQSKTIATASLESALTPISFGLSSSGTEGEISYNFDTNQVFVYNGDEWVELTLGDDLGNHTATSNLKLGAFAISNDGDAGDGLTFDMDGNATFGQEVTIQGNLYTPSDKRLKTNVETLSNVLEKINGMRGVRFEYRDQTKYASGVKIGVIAQELQQEFPMLVTRGEDGFLKVDYTQLTAILLQAIKEQNQMMDQQQKEIELMKSRMDRLEQVVEKRLKEKH